MLSNITSPSELQSKWKQRGLRVSLSWLQQCWVHFSNSNSTNGRKNLNFEQFAFLCCLHSDLHQIGEVNLPPGIQNWHDKSLDGPFVLQINEMWNIADAYETRDKDSLKRSLKINITDGFQQIAGFEYKKINTLPINAPPGTKVQF